MHDSPPPPAELQCADSDQTSSPLMVTLSVSPSRESMAQLLQDTSQREMLGGTVSSNRLEVQSLPHGP